MEEIPDEVYVILDPNDEIMGPIAEEMLTQLIVSLGKFDPTFKLKKAVFTLVREVLVVRFEISLKGQASYEFFTIQLNEVEFEQILTKYEEAYIVDTEIVIESDENGSGNAEE